jgi:hypothetical protein
VTAIELHLGRVAMKRVRCEGRCQILKVLEEEVYCHSHQIVRGVLFDPAAVGPAYSYLILAFVVIFKNPLSIFFFIQFFVLPEIPSALHIY